MVLFIRQIVSTLNSGHHQATTQETETYTETESISWRSPLLIQKICIKCMQNL